MVELGPASGEGRRRAGVPGPAAGCARRGPSRDSISRARSGSVVPSRRRTARRWLEVKGAWWHNRSGRRHAHSAERSRVTGVSGSGKSIWCTTCVPAARVAAYGDHGAKQHLGGRWGKCGRSTAGSDQRRGARGPGPHWPHAALQPHYLHQGVRRAARPVRGERWPARGSTRPARSRSTWPGAV